MKLFSKTKNKFQTPSIGSNSQIVSQVHSLEIEKDILQNNQVLAARNRGYFEAKNIFTLNLVSSPGSGKTSILERTLSNLKSEIPFL